MEENNEPSKDMTTSRVSRRRLLALLIGGTTATALAIAHQSRLAEAGHDPTSTTVNNDANVFHLGDIENTFGPAHLSIDDPSRVAISAQNISGWGLYGASDHNYGIVGFSNETVAVLGESEGFEAGAIGVLGIAKEETGAGTGVLGRTRSPVGVGVQAENVTPEGDVQNGVALRVKGRSQFNTILDGTIAAGADRATVSDPRVNSSSQIMVMLASDPGRANAVSWVEVGPGSFSVHLMRSTSSAVSFRAFIAEMV